MRLPEGVDYGYRGGIPGLYDEKGRLVKKAEDLTPQQLSDFERDYKRRRGSRQIEADKQVQELERQSQAKARAEAKKKAEEEAKRKAEAEARKSTPPASTPPASTPPARQPAPAQPAPAATQPPARQPAPAPATPQASPVAKYMAAAAAARKSGDPVQMAKVRDQGLAIWRDKYKDTLAKKVSPTGQQLGTGQSQMAKQAAELRAIRPVQPAAPAQSAAPTAAQTPAKPLLKKGDPGWANDERYNVKPKPKPETVKSSYEYGPYDLVLEYLLSEGHADTVEEAHYVMMQMDSEFIQSIVEMGDPSFPIKRSTGAGALTPDAAKQLGPKAVELQKQKAGQVALPKLPPV